MWTDKKLQRLSYVDVETKEVVEVVKAVRWEIPSYAWSPDSRWIAYAKPEVDVMIEGLSLLPRLEEDHTR